MLAPKTRIEYIKKHCWYNSKLLKMAINTLDDYVSKNSISDQYIAEEFAEYCTSILRLDRHWFIDDDFSTDELSELQNNLFNVIDAIIKYGNTILGDKEVKHLVSLYLAYASNCTIVNNIIIANVQEHALNTNIRKYNNPHSKFTQFLYASWDCIDDVLYSMDEISKEISNINSKAVAEIDWFIIVSMRYCISKLKIEDGVLVAACHAVRELSMNYIFIPDKNYIMDIKKLAANLVAISNTFVQPDDNPEYTKESFIDDLINVFIDSRVFANALDENILKDILKPIVLHGSFDNELIEEAKLCIALESGNSENDMF